MLTALLKLKQFEIIHADLKHDNTIKLDFGSSCSDIKDDIRLKYLQMPFIEHLKLEIILDYYLPKLSICGL